MEQVLDHGFDIASFLSPPAVLKPRKYQRQHEHPPEVAGSVWCALRSKNKAFRSGRHAASTGPDRGADLPARVRVAGAPQLWRIQAGNAEEECDSRYRSIISALDSLLAMLQRQPDRDLTAELDRLLDDMSEHFSTEESAMMLVDYPHALFHTERHHAISFGTAKLRYRYCIGDRVTLDELGSIRLLWLEHIESHDAPFARFLAPKVPPLSEAEHDLGSLNSDEDEEPL